MPATDVDAAKAAEMARNHALSVSGNLAKNTFKLTSVERNAQENIWKVYCEYVVRPSDTDPTPYLIKVNVATGTVVYIKEETPTP